MNHCFMTHSILDGKLKIGIRLWHENANIRYSAEVAGSLWTDIRAPQIAGRFRSAVAPATNSPT